jgi:hypothetical protein
MAAPPHSSPKADPDSSSGLKPSNSGLTLSEQGMEATTGKNDRDRVMAEIPRLLASMNVGRPMLVLELKGQDNQEQQTKREFLGE